MKYLDVIEARVKAARILASDTYEESTRKEYKLGKLMHRLVDDIEVLLRVVDAATYVCDLHAGYEGSPTDFAGGNRLREALAALVHPREGGETR